MILLPNLAIHFQFELPAVPTFIFRLIGVFLSFIFLYVSLGYAIRLKLIGDTYQNIINKLPEEYQRKSIKNIKYKYVNIGKIFAPRLSYTISFALFLSLFSLAIILIII